MNAGGAAALAALALSGAILFTSGWPFVVTAAALVILAVCAPFPRVGLALTALVWFVGTPSIKIFVSQEAVLQVFPGHALLLATALGFFADRAIRPGRRVVRSPWLALLGAMLAYQTLGVFWAPDFAFGLGNLAAMALDCLFFYFILSRVDSPERLRTLYATLLASAVLVGGFMFWGAFWHAEGARNLGQGVEMAFELFSDERWGRIGGLTSANQSGGFLVFCAFLAAGLSRLARPRSWRRRGWVFLALACFYGVVVSASRGAMLGAIGAAGVFLMAHPKTRASLFRKSAVLGLVVLACVFLAKPSFIDRMLVGFGYSGPLLFTEKKSNTEEDSANVTGTGARFEMWKDALSVMADDPTKLLAGLGPGGFILHTKQPEVHSLWLAFFFDMGLFGALLGVWGLYLLQAETRRVLARAPDGPARTLLLAALAGFLAEIGIHSLIDHDLTSPVARFSYLYFAVLAAALAVADREISPTATALPPVPTTAPDSPVRPRAGRAAWR